MGMKNSDDEEKIMRDHALLKWAKNKPRSPSPWREEPISEEERISYEHEIEKWVEEHPGQKNPYDDGRG